MSTQLWSIRASPNDLGVVEGSTSIIKKAFLHFVTTYNPEKHVWNALLSYTIDTIKLFHFLLAKEQYSVHFLTYQAYNLVKIQQNAHFCWPCSLCNFHWGLRSRGFLASPGPCSGGSGLHTIGEDTVCCSSPSGRSSLSLGCMCRCGAESLEEVDLELSLDESYFFCSSLTSSTVISLKVSSLLRGVREGGPNLGLTNG